MVGSTLRFPPKWQCETMWMLENDGKSWKIMENHNQACNLYALSRKNWGLKWTRRGVSNRLTLCGSNYGAKIGGRHDQQPTWSTHWMLGQLNLKRQESFRTHGESPVFFHMFSQFFPDPVSSTHFGQVSRLCVRFLGIFLCQVFLGIIIRHHRDVDIEQFVWPKANKDRRVTLM